MSRLPGGEGGTRDRRVPPSRAERGSVTAEFAMALPVLLALTLGMFWLLSIGVAELRVTEAARETARAAARGDADPAALAARMAPEGADIEVSDGGDDITVTVAATVPAPIGLLSFLPAPQVEATSVAVRE